MSEQLIKEFVSQFSQEQFTELRQDLRCITGIDAEKELLNIMRQELDAKYERERAL